MPLMALPPCHILAQFFVRQNSVDQEKPPFLDCQLYQRSCDLGLGVPFNIASYSLLTYMVAYSTGCIPGTLTHVLGDAHVYLDHLDGLMEQLTRVPPEWPSLAISSSLQGEDEHSAWLRREYLWDWRRDDFCLQNYKPLGKIKLNMSV